MNIFIDKNSNFMASVDFMGDGMVTVAFEPAPGAPAIEISYCGFEVQPVSRAMDYLSNFFNHESERIEG